MTANIDKARQGEGIAKNRKEDHYIGGMKAIAIETPIDDAQYLKVVVDVRWYSAGGSRMHCVFWVSGHGKYFSGGGRTQGYGYDHESASFQAAVNDSKIRLSHDVDGAGPAQVVEALKAISQAVGYDVVHIIGDRG